MRVLIDTCVVLDAVLHRELFFDDAEKVFELVSKEKVSGFFGAQTVPTVYYYARRQTHNEQKAREIIDGLINQIIVLDTTRYDCHWALKSPIGDYEDAMLLETAAREKIDVIVTRNAKDFAGVKNGVKIMTPKELIEKM